MVLANPTHEIWIFHSHFLYLYTQNIRSTLFDEFVLAHLIGWWAKALVLRNYFILWVRC